MGFVFVSFTVFMAWCVMVVALCYYLVVMLVNCCFNCFDYYFWDLALIIRFGDIG